jgi:hypothetical protein
MGASEGKPGRSPTKEPYTINYFDCHHGIAISLLTPPAQPFRQQDWQDRGAASCKGPGRQQDLADAGVSVMLSGLGV